MLRAVVHLPRKGDGTDACAARRTRVGVRQLRCNTVATIPAECVVHSHSDERCDGALRFICSRFFEWKTCRRCLAFRECVQQRNVQEMVGVLERVDEQIVVSRCLSWWKRSSSLKGATQRGADCRLSHAAGCRGGELGCT